MCVLFCATETGRTNPWMLFHPIYQEEWPWEGPTGLTTVPRNPAHHLSLPMASYLAHFLIENIPEVGDVLEDSHIAANAAKGKQSRARQSTQQVSMQERRAHS